jgi:hypothetical protein
VAALLVLKDFLFKIILLKDIQIKEGVFKFVRLELILILLIKSVKFVTLIVQHVLDQPMTSVFRKKKNKKRDR